MFVLSLLVWLNWTHIVHRRRPCEDSVCATTKKGVFVHASDHRVCPRRQAALRLFSSVWPLPSLGYVHRPRKVSIRGYLSWLTTRLSLNRVSSTVSGGFAEVLFLSPRGARYASTGVALLVSSGHRGCGKRWCIVCSPRTSGDEGYEQGESAGRPLLVLLLKGSNYSWAVMMLEACCGRQVDSWVGCGGCFSAIWVCIAVVPGTWNGSKLGAV